MARTGVLTLLPILLNVIIINALCAEKGDSPYERFHQVAKDYETGVVFLNGLGSDQLFGLCADYGRAVEKGTASEESLLVEECLRILKDRDALSPRVLLEIAKDRSHPVLWRILAARYASGKEGFVTLSIQDLKLAIKTYMQLIAAGQAPAGLRCEACRSSSRVILQGYDFLAKKAEREDHLEDASVRGLLSNSNQPPHVRDHNDEVRKFVRLLCQVALDEDAPPSLHDRIAPALRSLIRQCGSYTPGLDYIRDTLTKLRKKRTELSRAYLSLLQELDHVDGGD